MQIGTPITEASENLYEVLIFNTQIKHLKVYNTLLDSSVNFIHLFSMLAKENTNNVLYYY